MSCPSTADLPTPSLQCIANDLFGCSAKEDCCGTDGEGAGYTCTDGHCV